MSNLTMKMRCATIAVKYKNQLDFGFINVAIDKYCANACKTNNIINIGYIDNCLNNFKVELRRCILTLVNKSLDCATEQLCSNGFEIMYELCFSYLGIAVQVLKKQMINTFVIFNNFMLDCRKIGVNDDAIFSSLCLYLEYIKIGHRYINCYISECNKNEVSKNV